MGYTHGINWGENIEDEKKIVISEIEKVMNMLDIEHMPSRTDMLSVLADNSLANKVARTGGFTYWAHELNIEEKESETKLGQSYEVKAMEMLIKKGFEVARMTTKYPFDLLINDNIKIDVKVGRPGYVRESRVHTFRTAKRYATCDLYFIFALDENEEIEKLFIIPGSDLKVVTMCIGHISKYDKYIDRWDLIEAYDKFYKALA